MTVIRYLKVSQTGCCFSVQGRTIPQAEPDETNSEDDNGDAKNKGSQVATTGQEMSESYPPLCRKIYKSIKFH